jgi:hypothetical protein
LNKTPDADTMAIRNTVAILGLSAFLSAPAICQASEPIVSETIDRKLDFKIASKSEDAQLRERVAKEAFDQVKQDVHARGHAEGDFKAYAIGAIAATIFDVESTFAAKNNCSTCREGNALMRPFIDRGRLPAYAVQGAVTGLLLWQSYHAKQEGYSGWKITPTILMGVHGVGGGVNLQYVFRQKK